MNNTWVLIGLFKASAMQRTQLAHSHPPMPLEGSITSDKQLEMGWVIGTTGLVCWHLPPKYAVLLLGECCSWQFCYLLAGPCNLPTIISGYFLNYGKN